MMFELIQGIFFPALLCILFMAYILVDRCFEKEVHQMFILATLTVLILIICDSVEYLQNRKATAEFLHYFSTSMGYIIRPFIAIFVIGVFTINNKKEYTVRKRLIFFIPLFCNIAVTVLNHWTHWMYYYDEQNHFVRGPLGYITFVVGFLYTGMMTFVSIRSVKVRNKGETSVIIMLAVLWVTSTMLESQYHFVGFLPSASIIGIALYYLHLHVSVYSIDALTGAYNRRIFHLDMKKLSEPAVLVSMDLNSLKKINDTGGHKKGDEFIMYFSNLILKSKGAHTHFYRMGGDEFMLVCKKNTEENVVAFIEKIQEKMNRKGYSFAYGVIKIEAKENIDDMLILLDKKMYRKKVDMKQTALVRDDNNT